MNESVFDVGSVFWHRVSVKYEGGESSAYQLSLRMPGQVTTSDSVGGLLAIAVVHIGRLVRLSHL